MAVDLRLDGFDDAVEVGWGGFAVVYRAWQAGFDREVAIKVLSLRPGTDVAEAFRRECTAIGSLSGHPNIVTVHDVGETADGRPFIVMEYLHHGSLGDLVRARGPRPWPEATAMGVQLAGALESAHRAGLLHLDVKPENVLVSRFGQPKLGDFGIARLHGGPTGGSGSLVGSVRHAAPEVLGGHPPSAASDVYSLGSTLFTVLAGRPPFGSGTESDGVSGLRERILTAPVPDLRPEGVADAVCRVVEQALAKDPADRQASAAEVGRQLQEALAAAGSTVPDLPVDAGPTVAQDRPARRRRVAPATVAVVVVLGAAALAVALADRQPGERAAPAPPAPPVPPTTTAPPVRPTTTATTIPPPRPGSFTDDFSRPGRWIRSQPGSKVVNDYVDEQYRIAVEPAPSGAPVITPPVYAPITGSPAHLVRIEVDAAKASPERGDFGVVCGGPASQFPYGALVDTGGWWRLVRIQERAPVTDIRSARAPEAIPGPGPHRIALECAGDGPEVTLRLSVDGVELGSATASRGPSFGAGPGLLVGSTGPPLDVRFDNVAVTYS